MIARRILAALFLLLAVYPAQAQKTKAALITEIGTNWPDNTTGAITPALLRSTVTDIVNSYVDANGGSSLTCAAHQWVAAIATLSSITCTQPAVSDILGIGSGVGTALGVMLNASGGLLAPTPVQPGDVAYWNGSAWVTQPGNNSGTQCFSESATGVPGWAACSAGSSTTITQPLGRLTLLANTPVLTSALCSGACTSIGTLRYDCYLGGQVPYYNGSNDLIDTITSCEVTDAMVSAASAGQVVSANVYDVWWVHGGTNRICLAMSASTGGGGGWSSDSGTNTTRGTGYTVLDRATRPYITNKNSITNCFNAANNYGPVSANQGTYLGTVYASGNGVISYTFAAASSGGTAGLLGIWNMYNRVTTVTTVQDSGSSYTYSSATIRQARASAGNQVSFVIGLAEDGVACSYTMEASTAAAGAASNRYGCSALNATNAFLSQPVLNFANGASAQFGAFSYSNTYAPPLGFNSSAALEESDGTNANTFNIGGTANMTITIRN
jgi:hypothetical protein